MAADNGAPAQRWAAHPWRARGLRVLVYALPVAGSLGFVRVMQAFLAVPTASLWRYLAWWFGISVAATLVVTALYSFTRRLLPIGVLLNLSLVFPDEAPSRFKLAMSRGTVESLEARLALMREAREAPSAQQAAEILLQLVAALDVHDEITRGHAERVRGYSYALAKQIGLKSEDLDRLNWAALLHDIGKLEVSTNILNKPGKPTDDEWEQLKRHPLYGETLVEPLNDWLGTWTAAVGYHHERWDGKGYPRGLAGSEIPFAGRIVAIADVFDVITSARSYKEASNAGDARAEIARCAGTQFDPDLVREFVNISLGRMRLLMGPVSWLSHAPLLARLPLTPSIASVLGGLAPLATAAALGVAAPHATADAAPARASASPSPPASKHVAKRVQSRPPLPRPGVREHPPARKPVSAPAVEDRAPPSPAPPATTEPRTMPPDPPTSAASAPSPAPQSKPPASPTATPPLSPKPAPKAPAPPPPEPTPAPPPAPAPPPPSPPPASPPPSTSPPAPPPAPNVAPSFAAGADQSALEDAGAQTVPGWATSISPGPASESSQSISFAVSATDPSLFAVQPAVSPTGTLTYTPAADANGATTVSVTAQDDGGTANGGSDASASQVFTITLVPVNDAPSFLKGPDQSVVSLLGAQSVPGWATSISPGPADEASQTVTFVVTTDNPALFAVQPQVSPNGTLTYTPTLLAVGTANVTVRAVDNGGGADTSPPQTFTITIL
jgi:hypothetical protein